MPEEVVKRMNHCIMLCAEPSDRARKDRWCRFDSYAVSWFSLVLGVFRNLYGAKC